MTSLPHRQRGVVLLLLLLVFMVSGTTMALSILDNRQDVARKQQDELLLQLRKAKENLLAYTASSYNIHSNDRGPAFLPCPDTNNDGVAEATCNSNTPLVGRLPQRIIAGSNRIELNDYYADVDRQFWYVAGPRYVFWSTSNTNRRARNRTSTTNTNATNFRLFLDGSAEYVALIIAPGEALGNQNRSAAPTTSSNYLEAPNLTAGFNYVSGTADPLTFNDTVTGITLDEIMVYAGMAVAKEMKLVLDQFYLANGNAYPNTTTNFRNAFNTSHVWLRQSSASGTNNERWSNETTYSRLSAGVATLVFSGCTGMVYTLTYSTGITRSGTSC